MADFQSQPKDMYFSSRGGVPVIPFCVAACNSESECFKPRFCNLAHPTNHHLPPQSPAS